ncbi:hypothetical protein CONPUDRAFT_70995 [Coniophora puteana RWD-64-598 SS2]|uniref:Uncharacterized protein n=1 Tax=Coniophora puteana (strain RWD-64-598) TaxID=741705 RepID=A0A5M3MYD8_CONPW|nr:uncharacterized protein CONPUDRAFT_70995 [Coniophora puteana RWD-64-598 SS2]EIW84152.1 hypothetical protein CONPUDRAFT_70995 [Coniophora puteana RWD-64-598 SS2]
MCNKPYEPTMINGMAPYVVVNGPRQGQWYIMVPQPSQKNAYPPCCTKKGCRRTTPGPKTMGKCEHNLCVPCCQALGGCTTADAHHVSSSNAVAGPSQSLMPSGPPASTLTPLSSGSAPAPTLAPRPFSLPNTLQPSSSAPQTQRGIAEKPRITMHLEPDWNEEVRQRFHDEVEHVNRAVDLCAREKAVSKQLFVEVYYKDDTEPARAILQGGDASDSPMSANISTWPYFSLGNYLHSTHSVFGDFLSGKTNSTIEIKESTMGSWVWCKASVLHLVKPGTTLTFRLFGVTRCMGEIADLKAECDNTCEVLKGKKRALSPDIEIVGDPDTDSDNNTYRPSQDTPDLMYAIRYNTIFAPKRQYSPISPVCSNVLLGPWSPAFPDSQPSGSSSSSASSKSSGSDLMLGSPPASTPSPCLLPSTALPSPRTLSSTREAQPVVKKQTKPKYPIPRIPGMSISRPWPSGWACCNNDAALKAQFSTANSRFKHTFGVPYKASTVSNTRSCWKKLAPAAKQHLIKKGMKPSAAWNVVNTMIGLRNGTEADPNTIIEDTEDEDEWPGSTTMPNIIIDDMDEESQGPPALRVPLNTVIDLTVNTSAPCKPRLAVYEEEEEDFEALIAMAERELDDLP